MISPNLIIVNAIQEEKNQSNQRCCFPAAFPTLLLLLFDDVNKNAVASFTKHPLQSICVSQ